MKKNVLCLVRSGITGLVVVRYVLTEGNAAKTGDVVRFAKQGILVRVKDYA